MRHGSVARSHPRPPCAVAHLGAGHVSEAQQRLEALAARDPSAARVQYDLGMLLRARRCEVDARDVRAVTQRSLDALTRFLCLRSATPAVAADSGAWDRAAHDASELEHDLTGGTYWFYRGDRRQPPPFLPDAQLPPSMRTGSPMHPRWRCSDVLHGAALHLR